MQLMIIWFIVYTIVVLILLFGLIRLRAKANVRENMSLDDISIVVPFRNEAKNLKVFIDCIKVQSYQAQQWIFINDHSSDDFSNCFENLEQFGIRLLHLPDDQRGKKRALRYGMDHVRTTYCATMDADVRFGRNYCKGLLQIPKAEMHILPVKMIAKKWWQHFFSIEYTFTHTLNKGISAWFRPVNCSGANLLFHLETFDAVDDIDDHDAELSGDDIFALRAFRDGNKRIEIIENEELTVETDVLPTVKECMDQRSRWLSKTSSVGDNLNTYIAYLALGLHLIFFFLLLVSIFEGAFLFTCIMLFGKLILDGFLLVSDLKKLHFQLIFGLLLFEIAYSIYLIGISLRLLYHQPIWKGR